MNNSPKDANIDSTSTDEAPVRPGEVAGASNSPYKEVPVHAAQQIAEHFDKDVVLIVSLDRAHDLWHFTTFGRTAEDKVFAAPLGDAVGEFISGTETQINFADWRQLDKAKLIEALRYYANRKRWKRAGFEGWKVAEEALGIKHDDKSGD